MPAADLESAWDAAIARYRGIHTDVAALNVTVLEQLRGRWSDVVRPGTSMFTLSFTRPDVTGYTFDERVEMTVEADDRVRLSFTRMAPRRGEQRLAGPVVVAADFTLRSNVMPALEALLHQLALPDLLAEDLQPRPHS